MEDYTEDNTENYTYLRFLRRGEHFWYNGNEYVVDYDQSFATGGCIMCLNIFSNLYKEFDANTWVLTN